MGKYSLCIFSGGRGASTIISELVNVEQIDLTILLNAYDDGLSTGFLRKLVPGMLGPSDVRKTFTTILKSSKLEGIPILAHLLEYRLGTTDSYGNQWPVGNEEQSGLGLWGGETFLGFYFNELPLRVSKRLENWLGVAFNYLSKIQNDQGMEISLYDISLGNLLFVGTYLEEKQDFNRATRVWSEIFRINVNILNITTGENRVLVGLKEDGSILDSEASIVSRHATDSKLSRIYLLKNYLSEDLKRDLEQRSFSEKYGILTDMEALPQANPEALDFLERANMIVYGPGTQHSSLLPSYLTLGVADTISKNSNAKKVFISNVGYDHDIVGSDFKALVNRVVYYMNEGSKGNNSPIEPQDIITHSIVSTTGDLTISNNSSFVGENFAFDISMAKWSSDSYSHDGKRVAHGLVTIASLDSEIFEHESLKSLSIVVPVLNEICTVEKILKEILTFDWLGEGFAPQIIVVDGGSSDGTWEVVQNLAGVIAIQDTSQAGRGSAIRHGLSLAKGQLAVVFPADGEYPVSVILDIAVVLSQKNLDIVFGSRSTMCSNTDERLRQIYGGKTREYYLSKWGGFILSSLAALKYRRWISDPLTSVKGFRNVGQLGLTLNGDSLDWDTQLIVDSWKLGKSIVEIPVDFSPRSVKQGKKTTVPKGLKALWLLICS